MSRDVTISFVRMYLGFQGSPVTVFIDRATEFVFSASQFYCAFPSVPKINHHQNVLYYLLSEVS